MGWWSTPRPLYPQERDSVPIIQETGWAPQRVWTDAENLAAYRDSIPGPVQPVANSYADWAIATNCMNVFNRRVYSGYC